MSEIKVETDKGVVTLTGHAKKEQADKAVFIAQNTKGLAEVKNMIQVNILEKK